MRAGMSLLAIVFAYSINALATPDAYLSKHQFSMVSCQKYQTGDGRNGISISIRKVKNLKPYSKMRDGAVGGSKSYRNFRGTMETSATSESIPISSPVYAALKKTCDDLDSWNSAKKQFKLVSCQTYKTDSGTPGITYTQYSVANIQSKQSYGKGDSAMTGRLAISSGSYSVNANAKEFRDSLNVCDLTRAMNHKTLNALYSHIPNPMLAGPEAPQGEAALESLANED